LFRKEDILLYSRSSDKPGELLKISEILAKLNANVIKLDHNQLKTFDRFMQVQLEIL
jgi:threonine dehydratase